MRLLVMMTIDRSKAATAPLNPTNIHECLQLASPSHITLTVGRVYLYTNTFTHLYTYYTPYLYDMSHIAQFILI